MEGIGQSGERRSERREEKVGAADGRGRDIDEKGQGGDNRSRQVVEVRNL